MATILVIDDDASVRQYLIQVVRRLQHQAVPAATCAEGLARMADSNIDVVIADILLPDSPASTGEWVDQLKQQAGDRPLILITGDPTDELVARTRNGEVMALLSKPFELAFIRNLLTQATGQAPDASRA